MSINLIPAWGSAFNQIKSEKLGLFKWHLEFYSIQTEIFNPIAVTMGDYPDGTWERCSVPLMVFDRLIMQVKTMSKIKICIFCNENL